MKATICKIANKYFQYDALENRSNDAYIFSLAKKALEEAYLAGVKDANEKNTKDFYSLLIKDQSS